MAGDQINFEKTPKVNGKSVITDVLEVQSKLTELNNRAYLTESYVNGNNWYNKYSNGFIEQSGAIQVRNKNANTTNGHLINLLTPMKTVNYGVSIDKVCSNAPWAQTEFSHAELYINSFYLASFASIAGDVWVRWTGRGY